MSAIKKKSILPKEPSMAVVQGDFRCNLACPSCRSQLITQNNTEDDQRIDKAQKLIDLYSKGLKKVQLAGDGEALFTKWHRQQFLDFTPEIFPKLKEIILYTNGLLLNEQAYNELQPGMALVKNVIVSIDAGDGQTYSKVRGGDFTKLLSNLKWIQSIRKKSLIHTFRICFVVRLDNMDSIKSFIKLGHSLEVDQIIFRPLQKWENMAIQSYNEQAVHLKENKMHGRYLEIKKFSQKQKNVVFQA